MPAPVSFNVIIAEALRGVNHQHKSHFLPETVVKLKRIPPLYSVKIRRSNKIQENGS